MLCSCKSRPPTPQELVESQYRRTLDAEGRCLQWGPLRNLAAAGGVQPPFRPKAWSYLLGCYAASATSDERARHWSTVEREYQSLLKRAESGEEASTAYAAGGATEPWAITVSRIAADVCRTEPTAAYFTGAAGKDNQERLRRLLLAYAQADPPMGYCQGMGDLASPMLQIAPTEGNAYALFCALMRRMRGNFRHDGAGVTAQLAHVAAIVQEVDPRLHTRLDKLCAGGAWVFMYRSILLLFRREMANDVCARFWERLWALEGVLDTQLHTFAAAGLCIMRRKHIMGGECESQDDLLKMFNELPRTPLDWDDVLEHAVRLHRKADPVALARHMAGAGSTVAPGSVLPAPSWGAVLSPAK